MRRLLTLLVIVLGIALITGCAQRKVAAPEQPAEQAGEKGKTEPLIEKKTAETTPQIPKESISEKALGKAEPSEKESALQALQSKLQDIHFDFDKYDIRNDAKPIVKEAASLLSKNKDVKAVIEGHCDERGTTEYNLALGDRRAKAVKDYLLTLGIPSGRVETVSFGEEKPLCAEHTEECWAKNRRAHFVLLKGPAQ